MTDLLDVMARAAFAVHAAENADIGWEELGEDAQAMFRRSVAAAVKVALDPLTNQAGDLVGLHQGRERDVIQAAYDEASGKGK